MFTDLVGSTERWEREPDIMRALLRAHDDVLTTSIPRHRGEIVKHTGDGMMAVFDDADAAIACAIDIQRGVLAIDAGEEPLRVRVGLHCGPAERRLGDLFGSDVNRAARVMSLAHGGQILVTDRIRGASRLPDLDFLPLGVHRMKGLVRPEQLFQVNADGLPTEFPPLASLNLTTGNLPETTQSLVIHLEARAALTGALATGVVTTLVGPGGVGKTRLAIDVARSSSGNFPDGVWFVDLAGVRNPGLVAGTIATLLGVLERPGLDLTGSVAESLSARELLLVIDNCEHLLHEVTDVVTHLARSGLRSRILCTSQRRLGVPGEQTIRLEPLGITSAVEFFEAHARETSPDFSVNSENRSAVVQLCTALDGLPLALELAAARCAVLEPAAIAERLDQRFRLLRSRGQEERHRTLEAAIEWSYDLLETDEQRVLRAMGAFEGSFDLDALCAVGDMDEFDMMEHVTELVDRSVVSRRDGRLRLLDSVRAFAGARLGTAPDEAAVRQRHAEWFAEWSHTAHQHLLTDAAPQWLDRIANDLNDIRAALRHWLDHAPDRAAAMALEITDFWLTRAQTREGADWLTRALAGMREDDPTRPHAESWLSALLWAHGDIEGCGAMALAAVERAERLGARFPAAAGVRLSILSTFRADPAGTLRWAQQTEAALIEHPEDRPFVAGALGVTFGHAGDDEREKYWCDEAVAVSRPCGPIRLSIALTNKMFSLNRVNSPEAVVVAEECARVASIVQSTIAEGNAYITIAGHHAANGDRAASLEAYRRGLPAMLTAGTSTLLLNAIEATVTLLMDRQVADAVALLTACHGIRANIGELGTHAQQAEHPARMDQLLDELGPPAFASARGRGEGLTIDQTVDLALDALDRDG